MYDIESILRDRLLDLAKSAAADRRQFESWDDSNPNSGMQVGDSCLVCQRDPRVPDQQWATVTGNLPFEPIGDVTTSNNYFSIRLSRIAPVADSPTSRQTVDDAVEKFSNVSSEHILRSQSSRKLTFEIFSPSR